MKIRAVNARQILDSRDDPTVEAEVELEDGTIGRAAVPSGASTGKHEAVELRDNDPNVYGGKGVLKAVANINGEIAASLKGKDVSEQAELDQVMIALDGTPNKARLGANAILAVSLAAAHAAATATKQPLYAHIAGLADAGDSVTLPLPLMNIINGGKHATGSTDIQEFMIVPVGATTFSQALEMGVEVFDALGKVLAQKGYATTVGDEGGFAPHLKNGNREALDLISDAVQKTGFELGRDIALALDIAASELWHAGAYQLKTENRTLTQEEMAAWLTELVDRYPVISIEDPLREDDWPGWQRITDKLGSRMQIVGDDLLVTQTAFLKRAIQEKAGNAILIKPNQVGTLTEAISAVKVAHKSGWPAIISHRSGETEDVTIAHLAVGLATGEIKAGAPSRSERMAKYNELLRIEETVGSTAKLASWPLRGS